MSFTPRNLACQECGSENEPERLYCRACGAKLDRVLPGEPPSPAGASPASVLPPPPGPPQPPPSVAPASGLSGFRGVVRILALAAVAALLVQAFRAPGFVEEQKGRVATQPVGGTVLQALEDPKPQQVVLSEADLNSYLGAVQKLKPGPIPGVQFGRFFLRLEQGGVWLELRNDVWGWPLYMGLRYRLEGERLRPELDAGSIGRVRIPALAARGLEPAFERIYRAMDAEWRLLSRMDAVRLEDGRVVLVTKGR